MIKDSQSLSSDIQMSINTIYCSNLFRYSRSKTCEVLIGKTPLGGDNPIRIQSMNNTNTMDTEASVAQAKRIADAGAHYVRLTAPGTKDAENLKNIKAKLLDEGYNIPLIADIHFNPKAALLAAKYVEKVRINPGNFADKRADFSKVEFTHEEYNNELLRIKEKLKPLLEISKKRKIAIRIGTNHGSLSDRIMTRYGDTPAGMVESVMEFLRICQEEEFHNLVISIKSGNTRVMVQAYRLMVNQMQKENMNYPLHLGVTEAGEGEDGRIKSAIGIGTLLADGIGDTIRVSLTEDPEFEVPVAKKIVDYISERKKHQAIKPVEEIPLNPFKYQKRESFAVDNIGNDNQPIVILSGKNFTENSIKKLLENPSEPKPEYILLEEIPNWEIGNQFRLIVPYRNYEKKSGISPFLTLKEYLRADNLSCNKVFVELCYNELSETVLNKIKFAKNLVLILKTKNKNRYAESRAFFFKLMNYGIKNPVVIKNIYSETLKEDFLLKSAIDTGALFIDGMGDGIYLANYAIESEIDSKFILDTSLGILQAGRVRISKTEYISCPGCGRTLFELQDVSAKIRKRTKHLTGVKIGIMGCIVNGPGEMADADYGYVGAGINKINLYKGQSVVKKGIPQAQAVEELVNLIKENGDWVEQ